MKKFNPKTFNISQSFIKGFYDYLEEKICGKQFEARYIHKVDFGSSDVQEQGLYMEYIFTGALSPYAYDDTPPIDKNTKPYKIAKLQKINFDNAMKHYGFKQIDTGTRWVFNGMSGTLDILAEATKDVYNDENELILQKGEQFIIDLKYTGLIYNRFHDLGWDKETLPTKERLIIQVLHYKTLGIKATQKELPFLFFLHSPSKENEFVIYQIDVSPERLSEYEDVIKGVRSQLIDVIAEGFKPYPSIERCKDCKIAKYCEHYVDYPIIQKVELY